MSDPVPGWAPSWWQLPEKAPECPAEWLDLAQSSQKNCEQIKRSGFKLLSFGVLYYRAIDNWYIWEVSVFRKSSSRREETSKIIILGFFFLAVPRGMWDLSSPARDPTQAPCSGSIVLTTAWEFPSSKIIELWFSRSKRHCGQTLTFLNIQTLSWLLLLFLLSLLSQLNSMSMEPQL